MINHVLKYVFLLKYRIQGKHSDILELIKKTNKLQTKIQTSAPSQHPCHILWPVALNLLLYTKKNILIYDSVMPLRP